MQILWGDHNQADNVHKLVCPGTETGGSSVSISLSMDSEPLVIDGNGDNVADLFGSTNGTRGIWTFRLEGLFSHED